MLQSIRDKSQGLLAYLVIGLISIPFMLWGIQQYLHVGGDQVVASVNGVEITNTELQRAVKIQQQRLRQMFGGNAPPAMLEGEAIRRQVLDGLIQNELQKQYADKAGFRISDAQLASRIQSEPAFQVDGKFSKGRYDQLLKAQRISKAGYEHNVRLEMQTSQFQKALAETEFVSPETGGKYLALKRQKRDVAWAVIDPASFEDKVQVTEEQIADYYKKNQQRYLTEERVKLAYIVLDASALEQQVEVTEEALRNLYEEEKEVYATPETRKARHILIKLPPEASESQIAEAKAKAKKLRERIEQGESFETLAEQVSEDKLSAKRGGDLGTIAPGDMDPAFEKALFGLAEGAVSQPVQTAQGIHLIKVEKIIPKKQQSFEEAKGAIEKEYRSREANRMLVDKTEQLLTLSYESPDSLEPAADAVGVKVQETGWVTRKAGKGIADNPKVRAAAFTPSVLEGSNSEVVETEDGRQIVVRVVEREAARPRPLEAVRDEIAAQLKREAARKLARETGEQKLKALKAGASLSEVAKSLGVPVEAPGLVDRNARAVPPEIAQALFTMNPPVDGKPSVDGRALGDGRYALLQVNRVETPEIQLSDSDESALAGIRSSYTRREIDAVNRAIETRADLKIPRPEK